MRVSHRRPSHSICQMMIQDYCSEGIRSAGEDVSSVILKIADDLVEGGTPVIRMDLGAPDIDCPEVAKRAAIDALNNGESHYTDLNGIPRLNRASAANEKRDKGLLVDPDNIIVTVGASEALLGVYATFLSPGDEVLIPTPGYCAYMFVLRTIGVRVVEVPVIQDCQFVINPEDFETRITDRTKLILLNYPQNPTGFMYTREQLEKIAEIAKKHDLLVISDECYEKYLFEGEFTSISMLPGMLERTFIVNSVSKSFGMTGWRVGYVIPPEGAAPAMGDFHGNLILCATSFAQFGAAAAYENETAEQMEALRNMYRRRRDLITSVLDSIPQLRYVKPNGAFYIFVNVEKTGLSGFEFSKRFLCEYHVTCMPGEIYGNGYENYVRFAYTSSYETIKTAMERLQKFVAALVQP